MSTPELAAQNRADSLPDDITAFSNLIVKLGLEGPAGIGEAENECLRRLAEAPSLRAVPRLAAQIDRLAALVRTYLDTRHSEPLEALMDLLLDGYYTCRALTTALQGKFTDAAALEELFGVDRPNRVEECVSGLELVEVGYESSFAGDWRTDTSFLLDLGSGQVFADQVEATATAVRPSLRKTSYQAKLRVETARIAPGFAPQRIQLSELEFAPLEKADLDRALGFSRITIAEMHKDYRNFRSNFFAPEQMPVLLNPKGYYADDDTIYVVDSAGHLLQLAERSGTRYVKDALLSVLSSCTPSLVFGRLRPDGDRLVLTVLGALGLGGSGAVVRYPAY